MELIFFLAILYYLIYKNKPEKRKQHLQKTKDAWRSMKENAKGGGLTINDEELKKLIENVKQPSHTRDHVHSDSDYAGKNYIHKKTADIQGQRRGSVVRKGLFDKKDHGKTVERR